MGAGATSTSWPGRAEAGVKLAISEQGRTIGWMTGRPEFGGGSIVCADAGGASERAAANPTAATRTRERMVIA